jgi:uncharacterized protein YxjI
MLADAAQNHSVFFPEFFKGNQFFIDESLSFFRFRNEFKVYDESATMVGRIVQKVSFSHKVLRVFFKKSVMPFSFSIIDNHEKKLVTIQRGWTFWMSSISIMDTGDQPIGYIKQKFKLLKPRFRIYNNDRKLRAEINGDWKSWNFAITNFDHIKIGEINKKWAGAAKEIFSSADKYHVTIDPGTTSETDKQLIVATAITIDMVLKESR